jgi:predicted ATPase
LCYCTLVSYTYTLLNSPPEQASENAAFDSAAEYFKAGRKVLGSSGWDTDQQTMLKLCSEGANSCFICGDLSTMQGMIDEVIGQDIPIQDKFCVYKVKVLSAYAARECDDALETIFVFRKQLGLPTLKNKPISKLVIMKEVMKTNRTLGNKTAEDISSLPVLTENRIIMGQRMLELAASAAFSVSNLRSSLSLI